VIRASHRKNLVLHNCVFLVFLRCASAIVDEARGFQLLSLTLVYARGAVTILGIEHGSHVALIYRSFVPRVLWVP